VAIIISNHAKERIKRYNLKESVVIGAIKKPDETVKGYEGTLIAHKLLDRHVHKNRRFLAS
tara:strand:- start:507 stop:689 length:183 start_codon:yes stop_codon:yes gene_type:complete